MKNHTELPPHMSFFFIDGHPYLTTITGEVNYRKIRRWYVWGRKDILKRLQAIVAWHTNMGFQINEYHADNEFKKIEADLVTPKLQTQAAGEHKPKLEWNIRTLKDRTRSTVHSGTYRKMTLMMIESIAEQVQSMLNGFPSKTGISNTL